MFYILLPIDWASPIPGFWLVLQTCLIQTSRKLGAVSLLTDEQMYITWDLGQKAHWSLWMKFQAQRGEC